MNFERLRWITVSSALFWVGALAQNGVGVTSRAAVLGVEPNGPSSYVVVSGDGELVVFQSYASNLVAGTTSFQDIFAYNTVTKEVSLLSRNIQGLPANNGGLWPSISTNGLWVGFVSTSPDLTPDDTDMFWDVFVRDVQAGQNYLLHVNSQEQKGNGNAANLSVSADGRFGVFVSESTNLVPGDSNWERDVFLRDREMGITERVSVSSSEIEGNGESWSGFCSADGRYVVFASEATNLVPGDTNNSWDAFVRDRFLGTTTRISNRANGSQSMANVWGVFISDNGRYVALTTRDPLLPNDTNGGDDVYSIDLVTNEVVLVSESPLTGQAGNVFSRGTQISPDGERICFYSTSTDLVPFDMNGPTGDAFIWQRTGSELELVMVSTGEVQPHRNGGGFGATLSEATMSSDGRVVAVETDAPNLVLGDSGTHADIFVRVRSAPRDLLSPTSFAVTRGVALAGSLGSLNAEDGEKLRVGPGPTFTTGQPQIVVDFETVTSVAFPSMIEINITPSTFGPNPIVQHVVQFYNFQQAQFETIRTDLVGWPPFRVFAGSADNVGRFVGSGGELKARLTMYRSSVLSTGSRWGGEFDLVRWSVIP